MGKRKFWTKEETEKFIQLYPETQMRELVKIFKRDKTSLISKAYKLKLKKIIKDGAVAFTKDEIDFILIDAKTLTVVEISNKYSRDSTDISKILKKHHVVPVRNSYWWTEEDKLFLINNYSTSTHEELENKFNKKWNTIRKKATDMGLKRINQRGEFRKTPNLISKEEEKYIFENHKKMTTLEISKNLNRTSSDIILFCKKRNIFDKKSDGQEKLSVFILLFINVF